MQWSPQSLGWNWPECRLMSSRTENKLHSGMLMSWQPKLRYTPHRRYETFGDQLSYSSTWRKCLAQMRWPRGLALTRRQQLQLNNHLPAIDELLKVRALRKMLEAFGEGLISAINPVTGRLHANFLIAGATTGRFAARGPNLQQMPKSSTVALRCSLSSGSWQCW